MVDWLVLLVLPREAHHQKKNDFSFVEAFAWAAQLFTSLLFIKSFILKE
jgi:hypothetical protein